MMVSRSALPQAVAMANIAASIVVGKLGTAAVSAPELRRAVQADQGSERGAVAVAVVDLRRFAGRPGRARGGRMQHRDIE